MANVQLCSTWAATEENTMITTEAATTDSAPSGVRGSSSLRRAAIAIPSFVLAAFFIFAGAPVATAAQAQQSDDLTTGFITVDPSGPCRGKVPGPCPGSVSVQQGAHGTAPQLHQQQQQTP